MVGKISNSNYLTEILPPHVGKIKSVTFDRSSPLSSIFFILILRNSFNYFTKINHQCIENKKVNRKLLLQYNDIELEFKYNVNVS